MKCRFALGADLLDPRADRRGITRPVAGIGERRHQAGNRSSGRTDDVSHEIFFSLFVPAMRSRGRAGRSYEAWVNFDSVNEWLRRRSTPGEIRPGN